MEKLNFKIGDKFITADNYIYVISDIQNENCKISCDHNDTDFVFYTINDVMKCFKNGIWIKIDHTEEVNIYVDSLITKLLNEESKSFTIGFLGELLKNTLIHNDGNNTLEFIKKKCS